MQIHKLSNQPIASSNLQVQESLNHENSSKQHDELVRVWTYLYGLSQLI